MEQQTLELAPALAPATRPLFLALLVGAPLLGLLPMVWSWRQLSDFLRRTPRLGTPQDLKAFRTLARSQMIGALVQIGVLLSPWVFFLLGLATGALDRGDSLLSTGAFVVILTGGFALRSLEKRVQTLPCQTPELEQARDAVVRTWLSKPLPDWDD